MFGPIQRKRWAEAPVRLRLGSPVVQDRSAQIWWVVLLRALGAVAFGFLAIGWPRHTALVLVSLFGAYALADGFVALTVSSRGRGLVAHWPLAATGLASMAAGVFAFSRPRLMALTLIAVVGVWLILRGLAELAGDTERDDDENRRDWSKVVNGVMSALFGVGLMALPKPGVLGLMWAMGAWAVLHGLLMTPSALRLRRLPAPG